MTIFHVLKYDPDKMYREYMNTSKPWSSILPTADIHAVFQAEIKARNIRMAVDIPPGLLKEVLLRYEGPLE